MIKISLLLVALFLLAACDAAPVSDVNAPATLAYAQAQTTAVSRAKTATVESSQATLVSKSNFATQQAADIARATKDANDAAINAALLEQARTSAAADAQKKVAEASGAWLAVTQQAQANEATRVVVEATSTAVSKAAKNSASSSDIYMWISIIATALVEIGGPVLIILAVLALVHKWMSRDSVQQPHPGGPAFSAQFPLLGAPHWDIIYDPRKVLQIEAPPPDDEEDTAPPPIRDAEIAVMYDVQKWVSSSINYKQYLPQLNTLHNDKHNHGWDGRQLLTARECIAAGVFSRNGGKGEVGGRDAAVKWLQDKHLAYTENGNGSCRTFDTLGSVSLAIAQALAPYSPAAQVIDQKNSVGTPGEQGTAGNTREQPGTAGNSAENDGNTPKAVPEAPTNDPIALHGAVSSLPDWGGRYTPPKPPAQKQKAGLLRRVMDAAK